MFPLRALRGGSLRGEPLEEMPGECLEWEDEGNAWEIPGGNAWEMPGSKAWNKCLGNTWNVRRREMSGESLRGEPVGFASGLPPSLTVTDKYHRVR